jgi:hypothetical protein
MQDTLAREFYALPVKIGDVKTAEAAAVRLKRAFDKRMAIEKKVDDVGRFAYWGLLVGPGYCRFLRPMEAWQGDGFRAYHFVTRYWSPPRLHLVRSALYGNTPDSAAARALLVPTMLACQAASQGHDTGFLAKHALETFSNHLVEANAALDD